MTTCYNIVDRITKTINYSIKKLDVKVDNNDFIDYQIVEELPEYVTFVYDRNRTSVISNSRVKRLYATYIIEQRTNYISETFDLNGPIETIEIDEYEGTFTFKFSIEETQKILEEAQKIEEQIHKNKTKKPIQQINVNLYLL